MMMTIVYVSFVYTLVNLQISVQHKHTPRNTIEHTTQASIHCYARDTKIP